MDRETRLGLLAKAILEGTPVDWDAVDASSDATDRGTVRNLRIVAEIAALHRQPDEPRAPAEPTEATAGHRHPTVASWGHLRLLEPIARGAFGEVYRAWDTHLDREVALKLLRAAPTAGDPSGSLSDPARVVDEGRLLARVRHPNVITVYGAETREGTVGIWMEFIRGRTLQQLVEQQGPLGAREAAGIGADLCRALSAVHGAGLLHRDVTARNVMREDGGRVVLMDFGAGHEWNVETPALGTDVTGTPLYMAPELFAGGRADLRTDIYALGALLFYLVTGTFPVAGRTLAELRAAHRAGARTRLRDLRADLPAAFVRAVETAMGVDPAERCQTAGALEASLDRPVVETRDPPWAPRRPRWAIVGSVALAGAVVAGGTWAIRSVGNRPAGATPGAPPVAAELTARRVAVPDNVMPFSNPSADGRYVAGMVYDSGDAALVDLVTGDYRALLMGRGDGSDGYASQGALSHDGRFVAVDWYNERDGSLRVAGTDGAPARLLVDPPGDVSAYQWSRDGSLILAALGREDGNALALVAARDGGVRILRQLGSAVPHHASLSEDGRYVVYDYPEGAEATDHDLYMVDTHTGEQWALDESPGHDISPFWSPDGRAVVFVSDRNRNPSLWMIPVESGRPQGGARLIKDNIGRVVLRGFTGGGALYYQLAAGFAEVYVASIDGSTPPQPLSPRHALSNFYPVWSRDGRYIAYTSERTLGGRELWVYDTEVGREVRVPVAFPLGRPYGWSEDSQGILAGGQDDGRLYIIHRATGRAALVASGQQRAPTWGPAGIVYDSGQRMVVYDAIAGRTVRTFDFSDPAISSVGRPPSLDGRSLITQHRDGRVTVHDTSTGRARTWHDSGVQALSVHAVAPHTAAVAYTAQRKDLHGDVWTLMVWGGAGGPRELLRAREPGEQFRLAGWTADGLSLLVIRWSFDASRSRRVGDETLWRVPVTGAAATPLPLALAGLRDVSIHPDGRQLVFNAGFKRFEQWIMEHLLPR
ncbi:MAG: protein kinase domain-containing protein [Acidobacteriota bacterium]